MSTPDVHDVVYRREGDLLRKMLVDMPELARAVDSEQNTPLHAACLMKDVAIASMILGYPVDVNAVGCLGRTPLHCAVDNGDTTSIDLVRLLLENGANPGIVDVHRYTAADWARVVMDAGLAEVLALLEKPPRFEGILSSMHDWPEIHKYVYYGDKSSLSTLLRRDPNLVHLRNIDGDTPLHIACLAKHVAMIPLQAMNVDVNARGRHGRTPLHYAVHEGRRISYTIVASLLSAGANPRIADNDGMTPADYARKQMTDGLAEVLDELAKGPYPQLSEESLKKMVPAITGLLFGCAEPNHREAAVQHFLDSVEEGKARRAEMMKDEDGEEVAGRDASDDSNFGDK